MKTKCAIMVECNQPLQIKEVELPPLKEGQVLVKVLYSGVCHSQLNEIKGNKGEDKFLPHMLGHEGSGIVEEIGPNVTKVAKGDQVVLTWIKSEGKDVSSSEYHLENGATINSGAISTFSQFSVISENRVVKAPATLPPKPAALLGCAIPTGAGIIKNEMNLQKHHSLAIFGLGGIGLSALLYAGSIGCSTIIAIDVNPSKLLLATEWGASQVINAKAEDPVLAIKKLIPGGVDFAMEATGVKTAMEAAYAAIKDQGMVVIAGNLKKGETINIDPFDLIKGKKIVGTWGGHTNVNRDIMHYAELYLQRKFKFEKLISATYNLENINQAFSDLESGKVVRAIVDCQDEK